MGADGAETCRKGLCGAGTVLRITALAITLTHLAGCARAPSEPPRRPPPAKPGVRISMDALHRSGGVPPGWRFTPAPGDPTSGRRLFAELGCAGCHAVAGEPSFAAKRRQEDVGPELTGMGSHHPAGYFVESILNPDAILVEGAGYIGPDSRSIMPSYPDMTLAQLSDLVAYLQSLKASGMQHALPAIEPTSLDLPAAPPGPATRFFVQVYDVNEGSLKGFETWLRDEGFSAFFSYPGLVSIETYVDLVRDGPSLTTAIGFSDEAALRNFVNAPRTDELGEKLDSFLGPHDHRVFRSAPLYKAASLSAERPGPVAP